MRHTREGEPKPARSTGGAEAALEAQGTLAAPRSPLAQRSLRGPHRVDPRQAPCPQAAAVQVDAAPADARLSCASRCGLVARSHLRVAGEAGAALPPLGEGRGRADRLGRSLPRGKAFDPVGAEFPAAGRHQAQVVQDGEVLARVAGHGDEVSFETRCKNPGYAGASNAGGGPGRGGEQHLVAGQADLLQGLEPADVRPLRRAWDSGVVPGDDTHPVLPQEPGGRGVGGVSRDKAGQAVEFKNYMLPVKQEDGLFFVTGTRSGLEQQYRWLRIPADSKNNIDTFMAWRELMNDETLRRRTAAEAAQAAPEAVRAQFATAVENTLALFARGGYLELDRFVQTAVPENERDKMNGYFYQMLFAGARPILEEALKKQNLPPMDDEAHKRYLLAAMDAYTGLTEYPAPVLLQLDGFTEVRSSGLQMTKSPGASLVYLGSLLLVLGTVFMFYIREKRAWLLYDGGQIRFAMSSNRHERDLKTEFPAHLANLQQLAEDLNHDTPH